VNNNIIESGKFAIDMNSIAVTDIPKEDKKTENYQDT